MADASGCCGQVREQQIYRDAAAVAQGAFHVGDPNRNSAQHVEQNLMQNVGDTNRNSAHIFEQNLMQNRAPERTKNGTACE